MLFFFGLTLYAACGNRPYLEPLLTDTLTADLAYPVFAFIYPAKRLLEF